MNLAVLLFCVNRNGTTWSRAYPRHGGVPACASRDHYVNGLPNRTKECERLIAKLRDGHAYTRAVAAYAADGEPAALGNRRTQSEVEETTHD